MASGLGCVLLLGLCAALSPGVSAGDRACKSYHDMANVYHPSQYCYSEFCCGTCYNRYCCSSTFMKLSEDQQEDCKYQNGFQPSAGPIIASVVGVIFTLLIFICCCVCPCCCLYKMCRKPQPVIATTTHTTVVTRSPQNYPQQPAAALPPAQFQPYQPVPVQSGYGTQPAPQAIGPQAYGPQAIGPQAYGPQAYGAQPAAPYQGQPFVPGPPPTYQEATGPFYPPQPLPYSQAAFGPERPAYPLHPPAQPGPSAPSAQTDFLSQPAYNPEFMPPKTG